jgi:hypothetical protein
MRYVILSVIVLASSFLLAQIPDLTLWNNIRNSAVTAEDSLYLRCEMLDTMFWDSTVQYTTPSGWESAPLSHVNGATWQAALPAQSDTQYCRFRSGTDTLVVMMPGYMEANAFPPATADMSFVNADSTNEVLTGGNATLDIHESFFGYSDTRFYAGLHNGAGSFPTNSGGIFPSEYYFYVAGLVNPETALQDSVIYGMIYGNVPMVLTPGLYRFSGTEINFDAFERIGDLESQQVGDMLILACTIDDLTNDPYFGTWPNISKTLGYDWVTASFALPSNFALRDYGMPSGMVIDQYEIPAVANTLPEICGEVTSPFWASCTYLDAEGHFPLTAEVVVDGTDAYPLFPLGFDYSQPVTFESQLPITSGTYFQFVFSDNNTDFVTYDFSFVGTNPSPETPQISLSNYPNPFKPAAAGRGPATEILFSISSELYEPDEQLIIDIFNVKGQKVRKFKADMSSRPQRRDLSYSVTWDGTDSANQPVSSGVYLYQLRAGKQTLAQKKMMLLK